MTTVRAVMSPRTVPLAQASVNTLLPVTTRGERLQAYIHAQMGGGRGSQKELVERSGVKRQTLSKWTNPRFDGYPDLASLAAVASALGVRLYEIVAAMEGDEPVVRIDARLRAAIREEMQAFAREGRTLPPEPPERGAA